MTIKNLYGIAQLSLRFSTDSANKFLRFRDITRAINHAPSLDHPVRRTALWPPQDNINKDSRGYLHNGVRFEWNFHCRGRKGATGRGWERKRTRQRVVPEMRVTEIKGEWKSRKNDDDGLTVSGKLSLEFIEIHDGCEGEREGRQEKERERERMDTEKIHLPTCRWCLRGKGKGEWLSSGFPTRFERESSRAKSVTTNKGGTVYGVAEKGSKEAHAYAACMPRSNNSYDFNQRGATDHRTKPNSTTRSARFPTREYESDNENRPPPPPPRLRSRALRNAFAVTGIKRKFPTQIYYYRELSKYYWILYKKWIFFNLIYVNYYKKKIEKM